MPLRIGILATTGTIQSHLYQDIIHANGHVPVVPSEAEQVQLMDLIYHDIKQHNFVDQAKFHGLIAQLLNVEHCDAVILGCTELSVAQATNPFMSEKVIDTQQELAKAAVYRAQSVKTTLLWEQRTQSVNK
nr:aspartate/glutamate racemase family protein [Lactiplantibacillus pentosus]